MSITDKTIRTGRADIALSETSGGGMPVVLIHGNGGCKEVFRHQMESPFGDAFRMVALDLPGHGRSSNAFEPARTYSIPGFAEVVGEVMAALRIPRAALFGWSLGGHVALEMLASDPDAVAAVMITGTPPIALGPMGMLRGFHSDPALMLTTKGRFSARDIERFSRACYGEHTDPMLAEMLARTDERMRPTLFRSILMGRGADERRAVETATVPVAVVNGANEPFARLGYVERLAYATLWGGECQVVPGAGHAPFWETPELFNPIFGRFLAEIEAGRFAEPVEHRQARRA